MNRVERVDAVDPGLARSTTRAPEDAGVDPRRAVATRIARHDAFSKTVARIEHAVDTHTERMGVTPVLIYVYQFAESARVVDGALSLLLRTSLIRTTDTDDADADSVLPGSVLACVDVVHTWFFDLAEYVVELLDLQTHAKNTWGLPGRFLPEYSASYLTCKLEPAVQDALLSLASLTDVEPLRDELSLDYGPTPMATTFLAMDRLYLGILRLNDGLRRKLMASPCRAVPAT